MDGRRSIDANMTGQFKPKGRKGSSSKGRKLVRWDADLDVQLLLTVQAACNKAGVKIPWERVATMMGEKFTEGAIVQHLTKLRLRRITEKKAVPPPLRRSTNNKTNKKRKAADDDDSDLFVSQSDTDDAEYGTLRAPKRAKQTRFSHDKNGINTARKIGKGEGFADSDVQCAGADFLSFGHEQDAYSRRSASDGSDSDSFVSLRKARYSGKKDYIQKRTCIVRFQVKKSFLLGLKLQDAKMEEAVQEDAQSIISYALGDSANPKYPPPPPAWQRPAQMGMSHPAQHPGQPGTRILSYPTVKSETRLSPEGMTRLEIYTQNWAQPPSPHLGGSENMSPNEAYIQGWQQQQQLSPRHTGSEGTAHRDTLVRSRQQTLRNLLLDKSPFVDVNTQMPSTPLHSSPVPSRSIQNRGHRNSPFDFEAPRSEFQTRRPRESQSRASQLEETRRQYIDPKIFMGSMGLHSPSQYVERSSDMEMSDDFMDEFLEDPEGLLEMKGTLSEDIYQYLNEDGGEQ
ncbi:uncharacterized protein N7498_004044 [Penicillium cinerascens]|uniref:Myb-like domain-containing protein n=1 Tax=Penicillium cinerascens TaxID=70096 RepID=A0A9W9N3B0_9EURO|nr:uncharacterized protein N7498_004044 [Penicillium cinerascens]KAJ5212398.1 hypothetical protein N7498_004044 [Penicillium cinerascens]